MSHTALEIKGLTVSIRNQLVLEDINLSLPNNAFLGLIGPNGAGKTVLLKTILGLIAPDTGSIRIFGEPLNIGRRQIGYVPQYAHFDSSFPISVKEVVLSGRLSHTPFLGPYKNSDRELALETLAALDLSNLKDKQIGKLSGGQLQRVLIARALVSDPKILLLDEPTASLDSIAGQGFYDLLEKLSAKMAVVLVSHDIGVMARHVKTIACLNKRIHYHNSKEISDAVMQEVYGCPIDLLAHGHAHRVLDCHTEKTSEKRLEREGHEHSD